MRALITGITGFAGSHLADYLLAEHPTSRCSAPTAGAAGSRTSSTCEGRVRLVESRPARRDLGAARARDARARTASSTSPRRASCPPPGRARRDADHQHRRPDQPLRGGARPAARSGDPDRLLERGVRPGAAGRGADQGDATRCARSRPTRCRRWRRTSSPTSTSRATACAAVRTRGFNHTGPRRGEVFVTSNFASQIARIEAGLQEPVHPRRQPRRGARLHRRARHGARLLAGGDEGQAGRGLQHRQRRRHHHPRACSTSCSPLARRRGQGRDRSGAAAPVGRRGAARRRLEVPRRHRLGAAHSRSSKTLARPARLLAATARRRAAAA